MNKPLNSDQINSLKQTLQTQHEQLRADLKQAIELSDQSLNAEFSQLDNHIADQATELFDKERDIALQEQLLKTIERTEAALESIENGSYGYCAVCENAIPYERLQAKPEAKFCLEHQPSNDSETYEIMGQGFSLKNNDEQDATYFDGEDTTQALYQFGTSSLSQYQNYNYEFAEEFDDAFQNGVEALEDFVATDITGKNVFILRNEAYRKYISEHDDVE